MTDFAGWDMPLRYASEREEHQAVRTRAGLFDLSHMGEITVTGPDSGQALDYALVGHLSALLAIQGPLSPGIMKSLTDADLDGLKYYAGLPGTVAGVDALIARTGYTGEDGFELFVAPGDAERLWQALTEAGAEAGSAVSAAGSGAGLVPCGLSCRDTLRLEAGMPLYGHELTASTTPYDAGLGRVVKPGKPGDFVGREALRAAADRPVRKLVGLVAEGRR